MSKPTPYWTRVCQNAIKRQAAGKEPFTLSNREKAATWITCACGRQDSRIPLRESGAPEDDLLTTWGCQFTSAVRRQLPMMALHRLHWIELRAAELIEEEGYNGN